MRPGDYFEEWTERDRGMARGLLAHESSLTRHGVPQDKAADPDTEGFWMTDVKTVDYAAKALDAALDGVSKDDRQYVIPRVWLDPEYEPDPRSRRGGGTPKP